MKRNRQYSFIDSCLRPPAVRKRPESLKFRNSTGCRAGIVRAIPDWVPFTGTVQVVVWPKRQSVKQNGERLVSDLTIALLRQEATAFSRIESSHPEPSLYGVSDGKAIGTYLEHKFRAYLTAQGYTYVMGNAANGLDFPGLDVDIKVTSIKQPQSSCPFRSIKQKVYGLGYSLLVFVYDKADDPKKRVAVLRMVNTVFVDAAQTADFQMTQGIRKIIADGGSADVIRQDLMAFMEARSLTSDEGELRELADALVAKVPEQGYLTISPALQWRLQYKRVMEKAGSVEGVMCVFKTQPLP